MRDAESRAAKENRSGPGRNHFELSRTCFEKSLIYQLLSFAFDDQSGGILVLLKKKKEKKTGCLAPTAILYWTYPDELMNDPSFRVNQK